MFTFIGVEVFRGPVIEALGRPESIAEARDTLYGGLESFAQDLCGTGDGHLFSSAGYRSIEQLAGQDWRGLGR